MKKITLSILIVTILFGCTKNSINEPSNEEAYIIKLETVDLSLKENRLSTSVSQTPYNMTMTQKATYSNGLIVYKSQSKTDPTKYLVRWTKDNIRWVETISTEKVSRYGVGYRYFELRSPTGLKYYSMEVRLSDMHYADLIVENELPLYTLNKLTFAPIGGTPETTEGKLYSCMRSRISYCRHSWTCSLSCGSFVTFGFCALQILASCMVDY